MSKDIELIIGNSNKRFSGVTSTALQVLKIQTALTSVAVLGEHHMPDDVKILSFYELLQLCRKPLPSGAYRVFHARRNNEMIQSLIAQKVFGSKIKIAFTSTAKRHHTGFTRFLMNSVDGIISTCEAAASYLKTPPDIIIPHGVDTDFYRPAESRYSAWKALGLPGEFGIGVFGRVRKSKGIDILVDAAIPVLLKYPEATVVICGECLAKDEGFKAQLQEKIKRANLTERFVFLGKQRFEDVPKIFRAMTIVAALSRNEGFGLTPLEAMASGCAVLTSEAGAWKEIVRNGVDGYCVPTGNVKATSEKLMLMVRALEECESMGANARKYVETNFTVEREAQSLTRFLLALGQHGT